MRSWPGVWGAFVIISVASPSIGCDEKAIRGSDVRDGGSVYVHAAYIQGEKCFSLVLVAREEFHQELIICGLFGKCL
jgi:hypothetical protein